MVWHHRVPGQPRQAGQGEPDATRRAADAPNRRQARRVGRPLASRTSWPETPKSRTPLCSAIRAPASATLACPKGGSVRRQFSEVSTGRGMGQRAPPTCLGHKPAQSTAQRKVRYCRCYPPAMSSAAPLRRAAAGRPRAHVREDDRTGPSTGEVRERPDGRIVANPFPCDAGQFY